MIEVEVVTLATTVTVDICGTYDICDICGSYDICIWGEGGSDEKRISNL